MFVECFRVDRAVAQITDFSQHTCEVREIALSLYRAAKP